MDWAEKKARQFAYHKVVGVDIVAQLLRAERARSVRVCKQLRAKKHRDFEQTNPYTGVKYNIYLKAIDDCIAAIKGGSRGYG